MFKKFSVVLATLLVFTGLHNPVLAEGHGEPPVKDLEQQFKNLMDVEKSDDGEVKNYDSKSALEQEFKKIMVWPLADHYVDTYFYEENDKLYQKDMDGPPKLMEDKDYTLEKVSENHYRLTQKHDNELRGEYTLTINYSYEAGKWVFSDRMNQLGTDSGGEMPDTATNLPVMMMSGGAVMALGAFFLIARRRSAQ